MLVMKGIEDFYKVYPAIDKKLTVKQTAFARALQRRYKLEIPDEYLLEYSFCKTFLDNFSNSVSPEYNPKYPLIYALIHHLYYSDDLEHFRAKFYLKSENVTFMAMVLSNFHPGIKKAICLDDNVASEGLSLDQENEQSEHSFYQDSETILGL